MLFDSGSQRSCITSSLKSRLGLSTSKMETVHLNTFGQDQFKKQSCEGVRLDLQSLDGDIVIQMKALAFPVICSPVATRLDVNEFQHLEGLEFAEKLSREIRARLLLPVNSVGCLPVQLSYAVLCLPIQLLIWLSMVMELRNCLGTIIML